MSEVALFDVEPGTPPKRAKTPVAKTFRRFEPDQVLLLPPSLDEWLPADHLARFELPAHGTNIRIKVLTLRADYAKGVDQMEAATAARWKVDEEGHSLAEPLQAGEPESARLEPDASQ